MQIFSRISILLCATVLLAACSNDNKPDALSESDRATITPEITSVVQAYVNEQYKYLVASTKDAAWVSMQEDTTKDAQRQILDAFKASLEKASLRYTAYTSKVRADSVSIAGDTVYAIMKDMFSLTTSDRDMEDSTKFIVTRGVDRYAVTLVRKQHKWMIRRFTALDQSRFYFNLRPRTELLPLEPDTTKMAIRRLAYTYKPQQALTYAKDNWENGNSAYCNFTGGGGDCTNFLSQCLLNGGWTKNAAWTTKLKADCPACRNSSCEAMECYSCSWTLAQDFKYYITHGGSSRITQAANITDLVPGDILQYGTTARIGHSTLVTKRSKAPDGSIHLFVTYRSSSNYEPREDRFYMELGGDQFGWKVNANAQ